MNPMLDTVNKAPDPVSPTRHRVSFLLLLIGLAALLIGGGLYVRREPGQSAPAAQKTQSDETTASDDVLARSIFQTWLVYSTVIVILFVAASYTISRIGRRLRIQLVRKPQDATPTPDIWRMHRLPEERGSSGHEKGSGSESV